MTKCVSAYKADENVKVFGTQSFLYTRAKRHKSNAGARHLNNPTEKLPTLRRCKANENHAPSAQLDKHSNMDIDSSRPNRWQLQDSLLGSPSSDVCVVLCEELSMTAAVVDMSPAAT